MWNQGDQLLWEDNAGNVEPISGWSAILDPTGCVVANPYKVPPGAAVAGPLDPLSGTIIAELTSVVNLLLNRLNARGAFLSIAPITYPSITFQNAQSITLVWASVATPPLNMDVTIGPISGVKTLNTLVALLNTKLITASTPLVIASSPLQFSIINPTNPSVTLSCIGAYTYSITDGTSVPGTAYLFMNHLGININSAVSYVNRVFTASLVGNTIGPTGIGQAPLIPPLPPAPIVSVVSITPTSITITWSGYTDPNVTAFGISNNGNTVAVLTTQTYTVTGLTTGVPYTLNVYPLSTYDVGPAGSVTKTINVVTLDITTTDSWTPTPNAGPFGSNTEIGVASVGTGIWTNKLTQLRNINQIQSISLQYFSSINTSSAYISDTIFYATNQNSLIFYAYGQRLAGFSWAVGSPGGSNTVPGPQIIPGPDNRYYNIFNADVTTGAIDITKTMQFFWWCGYPGQRLSNCTMTGFTVTYAY